MDREFRYEPTVLLAALVASSLLSERMVESRFCCWDGRGEGGLVIDGWGFLSEHRWINRDGDNVRFATWRLVVESNSVSLNSS